MEFPRTPYWFWRTKAFCRKFFHGKYRVIIVYIFEKKQICVEEMLQS